MSRESYWVTVRQGLTDRLRASMRSGLGSAASTQYKNTIMQIRIAQATILLCQSFMVGQLAEPFLPDMLSFSV